MTPHAPSGTSRRAVDGDLGWGLGVVFRAHAKAARDAMDDVPGGPRGFHVLEAADGQEALALFELRHSEIALVLMDLTMPHLDGGQAFLRMHSVNPKVPVVLTSGYSEQDVLSDFLGRGLAGFLPKPYQSSQFLAVLRQAVEGG